MNTRRLPSSRPCTRVPRKVTISWATASGFDTDCDTRASTAIPSAVKNFLAGVAPRSSEDRATGPLNTRSRKPEAASAPGGKANTATSVAGPVRRAATRPCKRMVIQGASFD